MKFLYFLLIMILLSSCTDNKNNFKILISNTNQIPFPISFNTFHYADKIVDKKRDSLLFEQYKPEYANDIFGKLHENDKSVGMIYTVYGDVLTPILMTYNKNGLKIDSLNLFENASGYNTEKEKYVTITFTGPYKFKELDSTSIWRLNSNQERIDTSRQFQVDSTFFTIQDDGKIVKK